jgi:hypothetical protein
MEISKAKKIFDEVTFIKGKRQGIKDGLGRKIKQLRHILNTKKSMWIDAKS